MGINWNNVIKNQIHGMDALSAFYAEENRVRKEHEKEERQRRMKIAERNKKKANESSDGQNE